MSPVCLFSLTKSLKPKEILISDHGGLDLRLEKLGSENLGCYAWKI